jgi:hypothetical protein
VRNSLLPDRFIEGADFAIAGTAALAIPYHGIEGGLAAPQA